MRGGVGYKKYNYTTNEMFEPQFVSLPPRVINLEPDRHTRVVLPAKSKRAIIDTHVVNLHGVVVTGIQVAGHGRVPRQRDLGRFDQHDADVVDGRRLHGSLGSGHGYVDELPALGRRQVADTVFGPHVKLVRGHRAQAANRYLGIVEHLLMMDDTKHTGKINAVGSPAYYKHAVTGRRL